MKKGGPAPSIARELQARETGALDKDVSSSFVRVGVMSEHFVCAHGAIQPGARLRVPARGAAGLLCQPFAMDHSGLLLCFCSLILLQPNSVLKQGGCAPERDLKVSVTFAGLCAASSVSSKPCAATLPGKDIERTHRLCQ